MVLASFSCKGRGAGPPDSLARVRAAGVLRWGGDVQGGEPYIYEDPEHPGQQKGFEVDLAAALARELGVRPQFVQNDWSALVPSLERGTFDVILNGLEVMPSRVGRVRFTRPYYVFASRLMARRDDTRPQFQVTPQHPVTLDSLRGLRVGTLTNSFCAGIMEGHAEVVLYEGTEEPYVDLVQGRTDAVLFDDIIATRYGEPKPELRVVADLQDGFYSAALRPADETLAVALDQALGRLIERGELERILRGENIWNERQVGLRTWGPTDQARMLGPGAAQSAQGPPPRRRMSLTQAWMFVQASGVTLLVSVLAMLLAVPLGLFLAVLRLYAPAPLAKLAGAYVEFYRGTPVLLQLYVLYYGLAEVINLKPMTAAVLGLAMNYGAYEAEVYRAGIQAVPKGQFEAAVSLGMTTPLALRRVILPQAFRLALPSVTNDFIALLKDSSMVSIITVVELTKRMTIVAVDTRSYVLPGLLCAGLYFLMSYPLSLVAQRLEERLARS
ncbi:MAG: ABC transporter permease subunit [Deltaproteobacteria bacterium]|nr:ABC transporter permease subunit [Deltaproteobacteria bacterium]